MTSALHGFLIRIMLAMMCSGTAGYLPGFALAEAVLDTVSRAYERPEIQLYAKEEAI
jgi:hypothetical protein